MTSPAWEQLLDEHAVSPRWTRPSCPRSASRSGRRHRGEDGPRPRSGGATRRGGLRRHVAARRWLVARRSSDVQIRDGLYILVRRRSTTARSTRCWRCCAPDNCGRFGGLPGLARGPRTGRGRRSRMATARTPSTSSKRRARPRLCGVIRAGGPTMQSPTLRRDCRPRVADVLGFAAREVAAAARHKW